MPSQQGSSSAVFVSRVCVFSVGFFSSAKNHFTIKAYLPLVPGQAVPAKMIPRFPPKRYRSALYFQSRIFPSMEMVTTCHGINFPLVCSAFFAAISKPPQQGTSMRRMVTLWMSLLRKISVSFSL